MELDLKARLMGEALILNRSLDPLYGDYIELNDLNEPLDLRKNQVDDLEPTIEKGEVVDKPMMDIVKTRCDNDIVDGLNKYPSYCDFDRKIHIDCAYNLQFSSMIGDLEPLEIINQAQSLRHLINFAILWTCDFWTDMLIPFLKSFNVASFLKFFNFNTLTLLERCVVSE
ncbi:hypothetical protein Tco_0884266 [Tanacetum coccineum]